ncbi:MAG: hypothetical protein CEN88_164 [Candidatus Berkelbacteria bacterium Licking1014_2]|uniref:Uncharacterized protein n=1 Tax=Candidatus Berkelbacteria bacterium Licking1014_2 TaxID=2017146 RepID=A0A554LW63_9BACT|nr:MAG: hypothetical protein CEN88_164 [Candidatus Berkelbacteria bacterium Licking1014_2]
MNDEGKLIELLEENRQRLGLRWAFIRGLMTALGITIGFAILTTIAGWLISKTGFFGSLGINIKTIADVLTASQNCAQSRLAWPGLKPISFREGVLKIKAGNSAEANDWKMEEREIIIKINRVIGQEAVKRLIIV